MHVPPRPEVVDNGDNDENVGEGKDQDEEA
jgi:hypothetical protein